MSLDIQQFIEDSKLKWAKESNDKDAMSAEEIISKLEEFKDSNKLVVIEMNNKIFTSDFSADSWRGSYNLPSIEYYNSDSGCSVESAIENLQEIDGMQVTGYKGGDYVLNKEDPLFIANYGESNNCTAIVDIQETNDFIICLTKQDMY